MQTTDERRTKTQSVLDNAIGGGPWYKHIFGGTYTEGVRQVAEAAGAYWLIDAVMSYQTRLVREKFPFQVWRLEVKDSRAVLTMREDSGEPVLITQEIEHTDFPLDNITLWYSNGVLLLPDEY